MTDSTPLLVQRRAINTGADGVQTFLPQRAGVAIKQRTVLIDETGISTYTSLRKHSLVSDLQLRHRDIRALEPGVALPYPAAIFVRKQALILNLEGLKMIITKDKTLILSIPLLNDLAARSLPDLSSPVVVRLANQIAMRVDPAAEGAAPNGALEELQYMMRTPYELRALEAALFMMVKILDTEVTGLEGMTLPVLARIRRHVERADLELLYDTQNKLNKTVSRVGKIKEVLEELLDDPEEMAGMCLSRAEALNRGGSLGSTSPMAGVSIPGPPPDVKAGEVGDGASGLDHQTSAALLDADEEEVSELEDMIEAHWLQVDGILSRLTILQERITTTEHLVNLDLDAKRNSLVALGLMTDLLLLMFEAHMMLTSIFGMNLTSGLEPWQPWSLWGIAATGLTIGGILSVSIYRVARNRGLLFLPSFGLTPGAGPAPPPPPER